MCNGTVEAPALRVLTDIPEHELDQTNRKKKERMTAELITRLAQFATGDMVTATGVDTRGHAVTRTGYLLALPKTVTAQRDGVRTKGWRLFVGAKMTNPSERSTWVTLFPDAGTVEKTGFPQIGEWRNSELRDIPGLGANNDGRIIHFGGRGGKRSKEPAEPVTRAGITYTGEGRYDIWDEDTREVLMTCALQSRIWWALAPSLPKANAEPVVEQASEAKQDDSDEAAGESRPPSRPWKQTRMSDQVFWGGVPRRFYFGGLAKEPLNGAGPLVYVDGHKSRRGRNELVSVETEEVIAEVHSMAKIWSAPAPQPDSEVQNETSDAHLPTEPEFPAAIRGQGPELVEDTVLEAPDDPGEEEDEEDAAARSRRGVLHEGWLGEQDELGWAVWDMARTRIIGWLSADRLSFLPERQR
ncbi:hypothetical protein [Streptomyces uncialis]|uniref:hypothetical protein n=1 Tax=Streptomyces uncialis TaxID=1048205 RepID=UPI001160FF10|nr:hypothetical protein [Streptomyces uncialis]